MREVIYNQSERVCRWVGERVNEEDFGPGAVGIGLVKDNELIAGVVFNRYTLTDIYMHVAITNEGGGLTRKFITCCFTYPFIQLGVNRVTGLVRSDNLPAQRFDEHLGFKREGLIRQACEDGTDLIVYGMLRSECRWIAKETNHET